VLHNVAQAAGADKELFWSVTCRYQQLAVARDAGVAKVHTSTSDLRDPGVNPVNEETPRPLRTTAG
jgi:hypothetical protein